MSMRIFQGLIKKEEKKKKNIKKYIHILYKEVHIYYII